MKIGKISESVLKRTIIKEITYKNKAVRQGAAVGSDGSVLADCGRDIVSAVGAVSGELVMSAERAFAAAVNSVAAKGAEPVSALVSILLPETSKESQLRAAMVRLNALGAAVGVQISGGHTETVQGVYQPAVTVTALGYMYMTNNMKHIYTGEKRQSAGLDIVMAGETGLEGTAVLAVQRESELRKRFTQSYIDKAKTFADDMIMVHEAAVAVQHGARAMHDTSRGGVFGALWELGEYLRCGMNINLRSVPIRQETIELCEYFDMNPYFICSSGALIIATEHGEALCRSLREGGRTAEVIGETVEGHDKTIINNDERRYLESPKSGKTEFY